MFKAPGPPPARPAEPTAKRIPRVSLAEEMEAFFKSHKFRSFTTLEVLAYFPERKPEAVRTTLARMIRNREIKFTGEVNARRWKRGDQGVDHAYLTATIYKTAER